MIHHCSPRHKMTKYFRRWHERRRQTPAVKTDKAEEHHSARTKASSWRRHGESVKCGLVMACLTGTSPASHLLAVSTQDCMCKWEEGGDKEPEIECFWASQRRTDTSCPGQPESRLCLDREHLPSAAQQSPLLNSVSRENSWNWDEIAAGQGPSYATNRLFSHKVVIWCN